jgi:hypothetical protein
VVHDVIPDALSLVTHQRGDWVDDKATLDALSLITCWTGDWVGQKPSLDSVEKKKFPAPAQE